jgi:tRNA U34 5-methylaminomethyl-2-thiouridine-forming methyltransferase MnmC
LNPRKIDLEVKLITTGDGSHSLLRPDINETYHSFHGAVQESKHVFIKYGLDAFHELFPEKQAIRIFELGLGTGLNALLAWKWAIENDCRVEFISIEAFPIDEEIWNKLNFYRLLDFPGAERAFKAIHQSEWRLKTEIEPLFSIEKHDNTLHDFELGGLGVDVVFYDAFAPSKQPELWDATSLGKVASWLNKSGILVTYCAQGQFKRTLKSIGFEVETLPGPPGKKEMVRGILSQT